jgi:hypothetical protein
MVSILMLSTSTGMEWVRSAVIWGLVWWWRPWSSVHFNPSSLESGHRAPLELSYIHDFLVKFGFCICNVEWQWAQTECKKQILLECSIYKAERWNPQVCGHSMVHALHWLQLPAGTSFLIAFLFLLRCKVLPHWSVRSRIGLVSNVFFFSFLWWGMGGHHPTRDLAWVAMIPP